MRSNKISVAVLFAAVCIWLPVAALTAIADQPSYSGSSRSICTTPNSRDAWEVGSEVADHRNVMENRNPIWIRVAQSYNFNHSN